MRTIEEQQLADFHNDMLIEGVKESSMPMVKKAIGKNADLNTTDEFGFSPLSIAIRQKNIPLAQYLIIHGAHVIMPDFAGNTPLHWCIFQNDKESARFLIDVIKSKHGINCLSLKNEDGETPLQTAIYFQHEDMVRLLLEAGVNPDNRDVRLNTPLHHAVRSGNVILVDLLCAHGAQKNLSNETRETPAHLAARLGERSIIEYMRRHEFNFNMKNAQGLLPLDVARPCVKELIYSAAKR